MASITIQGTLQREDGSPWPGTSNYVTVLSGLNDGSWFVQSYSGANVAKIVTLDPSWSPGHKARIQFGCNFNGVVYGWNPDDNTWHSDARDYLDVTALDFIPTDGATYDFGAATLPVPATTPPKTGTVTGRLVRYDGTPFASPSDLFAVSLPLTGSGGYRLGSGTTFDWGWLFGNWTINSDLTFTFPGGWVDQPQGFDITMNQIFTGYIASTYDVADPYLATFMQTPMSANDPGVFGLCLGKVPFPTDPLSVWPGTSGQALDLGDVRVLRTQDTQDLPPLPPGEVTFRQFLGYASSKSINRAATTDRAAAPLVDQPGEYPFALAAADPSVTDHDVDNYWGTAYGRVRYWKINPTSSGRFTAHDFEVEDWANGGLDTKMFLVDTTTGSDVAVKTVALADGTDDDLWNICDDLSHWARVADDPTIGWNSPYYYASCMDVMLQAGHTYVLMVRPYGDSLDLPSRTLHVTRYPGRPHTRGRVTRRPSMQR